MKPVIGITCDVFAENGQLTLRRQYLDAVVQAGGIPVVLPPMQEMSLVSGSLNICQGLLLSGGGDLDPSYWGELPSPALGHISPVRDYFEIALTRMALASGRPVLGICRGIQVLNVAAGGTLCQDLQTGMSHQQNAPRNHLFHDIFIEKQSRLGRIYQASRMRVNSFHHQAAKRLAPGFAVTALSPDGTIEAIEFESGFALGVQWHPEDLGDFASKALFEAFIASSQLQLE
ncbi:MAG TPA: peptidase C26 [Syntrophomonas sp.]|jgi:putative glutamine amidotransferase|nr:peptidase C26 [Syntrophomonas sp.]